MKPDRDPEADALLETLLDSLLKDFNHWFRRGEELLEVCPDVVMDGAAREAMAPWHQLVMEVWALAAQVSRASR